MVVSSLSQFRPVQGREEEFLKIAGESKATSERLGAKVLVRRNLFGGEMAGVISVTSLFESAESRAEYFDRLSQEQDHPMLQMLQSVDPPALLLSRSMGREITPKPSGGIPTIRPLSSALIYRGSGNFDEIDGALAKAQELHESLGATVSVWNLLYAGVNSGAIAYVTGYDGWMQQAQFGTKLAEATRDRPGPLAQLVRSGVLTVVGSNISLEVDV